MDIAPVGNAPELTPKAQQDLIELSRRTTAYFEKQADKLSVGESNTYFTLLETAEETTNRVKQAAAAISQTLQDDESFHLVFFPAGALPIAQELDLLKFPKRRMHALEISGSNGLLTGAATIKETINPILLNPKI